ncbi:unnamed protein product [Oppiella nova]|uniref:Nose resistant-to-fluoxetine protein N-terminal domain-containing protein n=1 Tax=Oppiella nova TaxID=334625 RepID=A0A7R9M0D3_9ACAR|nr:unnamed protein product [Oppiella nova]CAG2168050.1 unnamed protein product [Oppiella nova]
MSASTAALIGYSSESTVGVLSAHHNTGTRFGELVECRQVIHHLLDDSLTVQQEWLFTMLDSSATLGTGILKGTTYFFGDYDECLDINSHTNENVQSKA